jgi:HAD superfamily hydrolase (TIGR01459 family)
VKPRRLCGLAELDFDLLLLDVWGVVHDGEQLYPEVTETLARLRDARRRVLLLSNASWREERLLRHLETLGIDGNLHCGAVTAGDVARSMLAAGSLGLGRRYWFAGHDENRDLLAGLGYDLAGDDAEADFILLTDCPPAGSGVLDRALARRLPLVCANPDVRKPCGPRSDECAGSIAGDYRMRGGRVMSIGKPHPPMFDAALAREPAAAALVCGDSIETDLVGARTVGLPTLWMVRNPTDETQLATMLDQSGVEPLGWLATLSF